MVESSKGGRGNGRGRARVLLGDDHPLMLEAVAACLNADAQLEVVGAATSGEELIEAYRTHRPDIVLCDYRLPKMSGAGATSAIVALDPGAKVVIFSAFDDSSIVAEAMAAGAVGYLSKSLTGNQLRAQVRAVLGTRCPAPMTVVNLSAREQEVLALVSDGQSNFEIGVGLCISGETVKSHLRRIYLKLGVSGRAAAVCKAIQLRLIS